METTKFNVPAISCSICSGKIKDGLEPVKGIGGVSVDLKTQMVSVDYNPNEVSPQEIRKKIATLGYEVVQ